MISARGRAGTDDMNDAPERGLTVYLVGGAVRDGLLGRPAAERDWVVVGADPEEMLRRGFTLVGRDFPVFLHPRTHEEYALARTERKTGPGYRGFKVHAGPGVRLEDDLLRRDLTVNAMAQTPDGRIIDPYGGQKDLEARCLRHVSAAFAEDPVRILRIARFAARYRSYGFEIAPETMELMRSMVDGGEMDHLVPERVWQETHKALGEEHPGRYFQVLRDCGALARWFPEVEALFGIPQPERWHPEIDTGVHTLMALDQAARLGPDPLMRFAVLVHDLGKGLTPKEKLPSHPGHEAAGVPLVDRLCERLKAPATYRDLGRLTAQYHLHVHRVDELKASTLVDCFSKLDLWRRPERLPPFLQACEADARGRAGFEAHPYPQAARFRQAFEAAQAVKPGNLPEQGMQGPALGEALRRQRIRAVEGFKRR